MTRAGTGRVSNFTSVAFTDLPETDILVCRRIGRIAVRVEMPAVGKYKATFQNYLKQFPASFIIYADLGALTLKLECPESDPENSNTRITQQLGSVTTAMWSCARMALQSRPLNIAISMRHSRRAKDLDSAVQSQIRADERPSTQL